MKHKIGLVCLSIMVIALAVGCSSNKISSMRANASTNESSREGRSEEKSRRKDEKEVSSDEFLSVGESAIVSKNITDTKNKITQEKVTITLDNVIRGNQAKNEVDKYNSTNPTSKIPQLINDSLEYVIIEYTTTLADDLKATDQGQASHLGIQVCNLDGNTLHANDNNYIIRFMNFEKSEGLQASDSGVTRTVITIPKNITEFSVKIGDNPSDMCSYIIN
ncbi:hypothetical protein [Clostridium sp. D53t1_180928_C8]|uniref:hypothetical protein n=1 Tax=Clostridium sp. D53t1_180928_C8 TaxID=2787101 RepID=UPI0018A8C431|nr:hypothetical protein [Clostridium sp. D53t1_180928_C8]